MDRQGLLDEINVYTRGENINKSPVLKYKKGDKSYANFEEAIYMERKKQRENIKKAPHAYINRISATEETISKYGTNQELTENALNRLLELKNEFLEELLKEELDK